MLITVKNKTIETQIFTLGIHQGLEIMEKYATLSVAVEPNLGVAVFLASNVIECTITSCSCCSLLFLLYRCLV